MKKIVLVVFTIIFIGSGFIQAQGIRIPGDTTGRGAKKDSVVYGPKTTQYIYEADLKYNRVNYKIVDTLLTGVHNYSRVEQLGNGLQYLGTIGSASTSIFPVPPQVIGATSGFNAYDIYYTSPQEVKFYNTRSPFSQLVVTFGGNGRSVVDVTFSRNVTANWNIGANVRTLSIDKQLGPAIRGDKFAQTYFFNFFTYYRTQNQKYNLMAVVARQNHRVQESGGIVENNTRIFPGLTEFYQYDDAVVWLGSSGLGNASDREYRFHYHLYHQYSLNNYLQAYHEFNLYHQHNYFFFEPTGGSITNDGDTSEYFRRIYLDSTRTSDLTKFKLLENEVGLKGNLDALFYNFYFKLRNPRMEYPADTSIRTALNVKNNELYGGFDLRLDLGEKTYFRGGAAYLNTNSYRVEAEFNNPILKASYVRARALPSYLSQIYLGNHNYWINNFGSVAYDQIKGSVEYPFGHFYLRPFITATNVSQPIFYRREEVYVSTSTPGTDSVLVESKQAVPQQISGAAQILSPGFEFHVDFLQKMRMENKVIYSLVSGRASEAFPIPDLYIFSRLYFTNQYLEDKITIQLGLDMQLTSAYLGYDYDVATQQFFIQRQMFGRDALLDNFELLHPEPTYPAYFVADLFFAMQVRRARLYVKVPHLNQGFPEGGYFTTPFYAGPRRTFDIGINWMFFD